MHSKKELFMELLRTTSEYDALSNHSNRIKKENKALIARQNEMDIRQKNENKQTTESVDAMKKQIKTLLDSFGIPDEEGWEHRVIECYQTVKQSKEELEDDNNDL